MPGTGAIFVRTACRRPRPRPATTGPSTLAFHCYISDLAAISRSLLGGFLFCITRLIAPADLSIAPSSVDSSAPQQRHPRGDTRQTTPRCRSIPSHALAIYRPFSNTQAKIRRASITDRRHVFPPEPHQHVPCARLTTHDRALGFLPTEPHIRQADEPLPLRRCRDVGRTPPTGRRCW